MNVEQLNILGMIRHLGEDVLPKDAKLVLFGSQARGDARQDSDWDLLILLDGERISNEDFDAMGSRSLNWAGHLALKSTH